MELVDRQEYISWKLPPDWHIVLTANPDNGEYIVNSIDTAQRTRFISAELEWDASLWAKWAEKEGIDGRCINFILLHPELGDKVNPRSITTFFNAISSIKDFADEELSLPIIKMIGDGSVGPEFSTMFVQFIHNRLDKLVNPKDVLFHENESYILGELRNSIGRGNDYRMDIAAVMGIRISNFAISHAENNSVGEEVIKRINKIVKDPETFKNDTGFHIVKSLISGNKTKFQKMLSDPDVLKMAMK